MHQFIESKYLGMNDLMLILEDHTLLQIRPEKFDCINNNCLYSKLKARLKMPGFFYLKIFKIKLKARN